MAQGIVNIIREWLYGPEKEEEPKECANCELLQEQLRFANYDRKIMMERILQQAFPEKIQELPIDLEALKPMSTGKKPWRVRQQELQEESRQRARQLRHNNETSGEQEKRVESGGLVFNGGSTIPQDIDKLEEELKLTVPQSDE